MTGQMPVGRVMFKVKAGWVGQSVGATHFCPGFILRALQVWVTVLGVGLGSKGLCLMWEQQGDRAGAQ